MLIRKSLESHGVRNAIFESADGDDGLDMVFGRGKYSDRQAYPLPGLVLLDIKMPRVDGFEVLTALKSNESTREIPVIMLTTSATNEDVKRCYKLGANAYLVKPVTWGKLWEKLGILNMFWMSAAENPRQGEE